MQLQRWIGAAALLMAVPAFAADQPYYGKWKFNAAKSDFGQISITFAQTATGDMQLTADGMSYTFKTDGKEYPALMGYTASWKQLDANTWETTSKIKGSVSSVDVFRLSADGKTLTVESKGKNPNGVAFDDTTVYQRASGTAGLAGKWLTRNLKVSSPGSMELSANGADGLTWRIIDQEAVCKLMFDGKDYPFTGPRMPDGMTAAAKHAGSRSLSMTFKKDGKTLYEVVYTVSDDGKTMTETGNATGVSEKYKVVYDKQ